MRITDEHLRNCGITTFERLTGILDTPKKRDKFVEAMLAATEQERRQIRENHAKAWHEAHSMYLL